MSRKGSPNRNKAFLLKRLQDMYGDDFHPILKMSENAVKMQEQVDSSESSVSDRKTVIDAWEKVAQYTEPKLAAVEVTAEISQVDTDGVKGEIEQLLAARTSGDS